MLESLVREGPEVDEAKLANVRPAHREQALLTCATAHLSSSTAELPTTHREPKLASASSRDSATLHRVLLAHGGCEALRPITTAA